MQSPKLSTTTQIIHLLPNLTEGDRVRLLQFAKAMIRQRQDKRQQRSARFQAPVNDSWRIGN